MNAIVKAVVALAALLAFGTPAAASSPSLFGSVEFRAQSLAALPQWQKTLARIEKERPVHAACARSPASCPSRSVLALQSLIKGQIGRARIEQITAVNQFFNNWQYKTDEENYGQRDHWATPLEFLSRSGDCEDYAIAKYVALRQLGFPAERLRIVVVRDVLRDLAHAVLAAYVGDQVYILDNLTRAVLPDERVTQYVPYYSINETTRWAHVMPADTLVSATGGGRSSSGPAAP